MPGRNTNGLSKNGPGFSLFEERTEHLPQWSQQFAFLSVAHKSSPSHTLWLVTCFSFTFEREKLYLSEYNISGWALRFSGLSYCLEYPCLRSKCWFESWLVQLPALAPGMVAKDDQSTWASGVPGSSGAQTRLF